MKILLISHLFYPKVGGVEVAVAALAKQFIMKGHTVEIVTTRMPKTLPEVAFADGIRVTRLPFRLPGKSLRSFVSFLILLL